MTSINYSKILFLSTMILGTLISISANSWPAMWMGLEMNLLSFIPIMIQKKNILTSEASLKYFLVQAMASSIFLISSLFNFLFHEILPLISNSFHFFIFFSLMLKLGMSPFHLWFPSVMEGLSWLNCYILMIWQKIAPMIMMLYLNLKFFFTVPFIIFSIFIGSMGGLNQTSLRKLMAYSSINHMGWMLIALLNNSSIWFLYFLTYTFIISTLIFFFSTLSVMHLNQLILKFQFNPLLKFIFLLNLFSLGGLPPFLGFLPKWLIIQNISKEFLIFMNFLLILSSLITLYFYIQISISSFLFISIQSKWISTLNTLKDLTLILFFLSLSSLLVYPLLTFI